MELSEFLLARIAEVDSAWRNVRGARNVEALRAWILAQCEATRHIAERITDGCGHPWVSDDGATRRWLGGWCLDCDQHLRDLAAVYADHPDYPLERQESPATRR